MQFILILLIAALCAPLNAFVIPQSSLPPITYHFTLSKRLSKFLETIFIETHPSNIHSITHDMPLISAQSPRGPEQLIQTTGNSNDRLRKLEISLKELSAKKEKAIKVSDDPQTRGYFETLEKTLVRKIDAMNKMFKNVASTDSIDLTKAKGREAFD